MAPSSSKEVSLHQTQYGSRISFPLDSLIVLARRLACRSIFEVPTLGIVRTRASRTIDVDFIGAYRTQAVMARSRRSPGLSGSQPADRTARIAARGQPNRTARIAALRLSSPAIDLSG